MSCKLSQVARGFQRLGAAPSKECRAAAAASAAAAAR